VGVRNTQNPVRSVWAFREIAAVIRIAAQKNEFKRLIGVPQLK
jgi:hypothetical protein